MLEPLEFVQLLCTDFHFVVFVEEAVAILGGLTFYATACLSVEQEVDVYR